ncbi:MAG: hypothetical protein Alis3KO_05490 [Aliiglaciecola sp.]
MLRTENRILSRGISGQTFYLQHAELDFHWVGRLTALFIEHDITKCELYFCSFSDKTFAKLCESVFTRLTTLSLRGCTLENDEIFAITKLTHLKELDLSGTQRNNNDIACIATMNNLHSLKVAGTNIGYLDGIRHIATMHNLKRLDISGLSATRIGLYEKTWELIASMSNLTLLHCKDCTLNTSNFFHIASMKNLEDLDVGFNEINEEMAVHISQMAKLTHLGIENTKNKAVLKSVAQMTNLLSLDCSNTDLRLTINYIVNMRALTDLKISQCTIDEKVLHQISTMTNLVALFIDNTKLNDSDAEYLANLTKLKHLSAKENNLSDKGAIKIAELLELEQIKLNGNRIQDNGAAKLIKLPKLEAIDLSKNKLSVPDSIHSDTEALKDRFAILAVAEMIPLTTLRTMIIGQPEVGKSTVMRAFQSLPLDIGELTRTQGFERFLLTLENMKHHNKHIDVFTPKLDIWDFGGQTLQQMIHSLFYRGGCLYLLVVNEQTTQDHVDNWLSQIVPLHTVKRPVYLLPVVNTHTEISPDDLIQSKCIFWDRLREHCSVLGPSILSIRQNKSSETHGVHATGDVDSPLTYIKAKLPYVPFPLCEAPFEAIARLIKQLPEPFYERNVFESEVKRLPDVLTVYNELALLVLNKQQRKLTIDVFFDNLVFYLDQMGSLTYIGHPDENGWVILDPVWVQNGLYAILPPDDDKLAESVATQCFRKRLLSTNTKVGLPCTFSLREFQPVVQEMFEKESINPLSINGLTQQLLGLLSHPNLGLLIPLPKKRQYLIPAYLEELETYDPIKQARKLVRNYSQATYRFIVDKPMWPVHFIYRLMVWCNTQRPIDKHGLHTYSDAPVIDVRSFETVVEAIQSRSFRLLEPNKKDIEIEVVEYGEKLWFFGFTNDTYREHQVQLAIYQLSKDIKEFLGKLNDPAPGEAKLMIPCPKCMEELTCDILDLSNPSVNDVKNKINLLKGIGLFRYSELNKTNSNHRDSETGKYHCSHRSAHAFNALWLLASNPSANSYRDRILPVAVQEAHKALAEVTIRLYELKHAIKKSDIYERFHAENQPVPLSTDSKDIVNAISRATLEELVKLKKVPSLITLNTHLYHVLTRYKTVWQWLGAQPEAISSPAHINTTHYSLIVDIANKIPKIPALQPWDKEKKSKK